MIKTICFFPRSLSRDDTISSYTVSVDWTPLVQKCFERKQQPYRCELPSAGPCEADVQVYKDFLFVARTR